MNKPRVWFERPVPASHAKYVADRTEPLGPATSDHPYAAIETAVGAVAGSVLVDAALFDRAPDLIAVGRTGIGYDTVDVEEATRRGIAVMNVPEGPTTSTAEHTIALMLAVAKQIKPSQQLLEDQGGDYYAQHRGVELDGKTLGLLGFGRIARHVAGIATAMGMKILAFDPYISSETFPDVVARATGVDDVLENSDVVSVHVPLNDDTHRLIDADAFAAMKPGAVFVNAARGGIVDTDALVAALDAGHLLGAGIDVTDPEPLPGGHPLLGRNDVVVTPHVASGTPEARERNFLGAIDQVLEVLAGVRPTNLVNPEAWEAVVGRVASK